MKVVSHPFQVVPVLPVGNSLQSTKGRNVVGELRGDLQYVCEPVNSIASKNGIIYVRDRII